MHQHAMQLAARSSVVLLALAAVGVVVPTAARNKGHHTRRAIQRRRIRSSCVRRCLTEG